MALLTIDLSASGPAFREPLPDAVHEETNAAINKLAEEGQGLVQRQLYPGHGKITGHLQRSVHGGLVRDLTGQVDAGLHQQGANVYYATWIEGIDPRNRRSHFQGYHMFKQAHEQLEQVDIAAYLGARLARRFNDGSGGTR